MRSKLRNTTGDSRLHDFLLEWGANTVAHSGRMLYEHLCGVESVLRAWEQPEYVCRAGLFHSIYGTESFTHETVPISERATVSSLIGQDAERLVYLFAVLSRHGLMQAARSDSVLRDDFAEASCHQNGSALRVSRDEMYRLVLLHVANRMEQSSKPITGIGYWLEFAGQRVDTIRRIGNAVPTAVARLEGFTFDDERKLNSLYLQGVSSLAQGDPGSAVPYLEQATGFGVVAEPFILLALAQRWMEEPEAARRTVLRGRELLEQWGAPWHKHLSVHQWRRLADLLSNNAGTEDITQAVRGLFSKSGGTQQTASRENGPQAPAVSLAPAEHDAAQRFIGYLRNVRSRRSKDAVKWYPGLASQPWYDAAQFPVVERLQSHYAAIKSEAERVRPSAYFEEAEEIGRMGSWQVCMFYEHGRRHARVCEQCPVIASILDSDPSIRRSAGLIYLSKMAPHTHIAAHKGASNMRLRCHLALSIPEGDCAIRVGNEIRNWQEGKCIVFDDTFEHEVWNRTDRERLVLLIDLWHPGLSTLERDSLDTVNWLGIWQANSLVASWKRNDAERAKERQSAEATIA